MSKEKIWIDKKKMKLIKIYLDFIGIYQENINALWPFVKIGIIVPGAEGK